MRGLANEQCGWGIYIAGGRKFVLVALTEKKTGHWPWSQNDCVGKGDTRTGADKVRGENDVPTTQFTGSDFRVVDAVVAVDVAVAEMVRASGEVVAAAVVVTVGVAVTDVVGDAVGVVVAAAEARVVVLVVAVWLG